MWEDDDGVELPKTLFGSGEPTLHFDRIMKTHCLKCESECRVTDFSFVCSFCGSSNFGMETFSLFRKGGEQNEYH